MEEERLTLPMRLQATVSRALLLSLLAAGLLVPLGLLARHLGLGPGTVPLIERQGRSFWLLGTLLALAVGALYQVTDRETRFALQTAAERQVRYEPASELPTAWILPAVATFAAVMLLEVYHQPSTIAGIAVGTFLLLSSATIARHYLYDADEISRQRAHGVYTVLIHIVAFVALAMVYINKMRSIFSASMVLVIAVLLLLQVTDGEDALFARRLVYALVGGIMLGQVTWVLNYWKATGWTGGAVLLIFFYFAAGLMSAHLRRGVETHDIVEYSGVGLIAFAIVLYSILR